MSPRRHCLAVSLPVNQPAPKPTARQARTEPQTSLATADAPMVSSLRRNIAHFRPLPPPLNGCKLQNIKLNMLVAFVIVGLAIPIRASEDRKNWLDVCDRRLTSIETKSQMLGLYWSVTVDFLDRLCFKMREDSKPVVTVINTSSSRSACVTGIAKLYLEMDQKNFGHGIGHHMPPVVRKYAMALAHQISAMCKLNALDHIEQLDKVMNSEPDIEQLLERLDKTGLLLLADPDRFGLNKTQQTDQLQLYSQLDSLMASLPDSEIEALSDKARKELYKLGAQCEFNFRPVFGSLFYTVSILSRLDLDYPMEGELAEGRRKQLNSSRMLAKWLSVALICRALEPLAAGAHGEMPSYKNMVKADQTMFQPKHSLPDQRSISDLEMSEMKVPKSRADKEARKIVGMIYAQVVGDKRNILDKVGLSGVKFWKSYIELMAAKLSS